MSGPDVDEQAHCPVCGAAFPASQVFCVEDGSRLIPWQPRREAIVGTVLDGRFQIVERIGEGGMGLVYRGVQLSVDRPVAIKVIRDDLSQDPAAARRFLREARMATTFSHPNIVHVFELGQAESGALYLVMEMLRGRTLEAELRLGTFSAGRACEVASQLCDALAAAHERGIVHRDLKPANIMLLDDPAVRDLVKVLDFGLAKSLGPEATALASRVTMAGELLGTPMYMAPEAIADSNVDPRSDLYAVGCILHEMLAGAPPFTGLASHVVFARHVADPPPPLPDSVPPQVAALVEALLAKTPEERPASAAEVRDHLHAFLATTSREAIDVDEVTTLIHESARRRFPAGTASPPTVDGESARRRFPAGTASPPAVVREPERPRFRAPIASRPTVRVLVPAADRPAPRPHPLWLVLALAAVALAVAAIALIVIYG